MKKFEIPEHYRSGTIAKVKEWRKQRDPRKKDFEPTVLDLGPVEFVLPRHFGFCYGVENAIEISYKAISENPGKRIYLLSQMIHNPAVNDDLQSRGIRFIMDTEGNQLVPWDQVTSDDVVIIPAFGTTLEIEALLKEKGVVTSVYNTTCPFVEKVWKRSAEIGTKGYTIIIHGKYKHEETRATFSHSSAHAPSIVVRDMKEARALADFVEGKRPLQEFDALFGKRVSKNFDITKDLEKVGVVNQTTMLATETQEIADFFKRIMMEKYGEEGYKEHFADTRDTLCYATNDNQEATVQALGRNSDLALVIGGYNSSNTAQLVTILQREMPVYYISGTEEIASSEEIRHVEYGNPEAKQTMNWLPKGKEKLRVVLTSGASCPDAIVEAVMLRVLSFFDEKREIQKVLDELMEA
jgi:4-hydroxy-3-methylbut-2-enyl diphosphate reductase